MSGSSPITAQLDDHSLAAALAEGAGGVLLTVRGGFPAGHDRGAAGDAAAQDWLSESLARCRPSDAVLSEEAVDDAARLASRRVWIVDPLDGTREFSEDGRTDWAVHVALWEDGDLVAGAVALPALGRLLATPTVPPPTTTGTLKRITVSRTRPPAVAEAVAERLGAALVPMGSAGAKAAAVVTGEVDAYVHAGGQYEWDSAAPVAVARAAGLHASRLDGSALRYNEERPYLADLIVCRPELAASLLAAVGAELAIETTSTGDPS
ncbi:MAG TPA: 3'(2'),5'-bisphosphate nucleotidase CysQ [Acidimicrobiales bacterium]|nr:3'(2'),5'-bisphosphate nucleotidase CysQ [Acidimicrobiales bacterium]